MDFNKVCSNYAPGTKNGPTPGDHMFYIGLYRENNEIILSDTIRLRAFIFGMKHHLVNLYQVCSNYIPGAKNGPAPGLICFT